MTGDHLHIAALKAEMRAACSHADGQAYRLANEALRLLAESSPAARHRAELVAIAYRNALAKVQEAHARLDEAQRIAGRT